MTGCISVSRELFNTHEHKYDHAVWTQSLPMLPCRRPQAMKLPWEDVSAAPAVSPLGPSLLWGLATAQGCLPVSKGTGSTATAWNAEVRARPFYSQGQGHHHCGGFSFHALLRLQEASPMWRGDAAQRQPAPPRLLRIPSSHHYRPSARPGAAAGAAQQHDTRLLFSLESLAFGYLHTFLRERQEAKWIRNIYGYLRPCPYPHLDGDTSGWAHTLLTTEMGQEATRNMGNAIPPGAWVETRNGSGPGGAERQAGTPLASLAATPPSAFPPGS